MNRFNNLSAIFCGLLVCCVGLIKLPAIHAQQDSNASKTDEMLAMLLQRVQEDPQHSDSWRLLGKVHERQGDIEKALDAYRRALFVSFDNAAAHHDLGRLMYETNRDSAAEFHFQKVFELAPESDYAISLIELGIEPEEISADDWDSEGESRIDVMQPEDNDVIPASFEIQTFDGSADFNRRLDQIQSESEHGPKRFNAYLETGTLYNSNITLTPISRELINVDAASAQMFVNPELQWSVLASETCRMGPIARGYFTVNESNFSSLNLSSFQPGAFFERSIFTDEKEWIARFDYLYSLDLFGGDRLGDRHSGTCSLTSIHDGGDIKFVYATIAWSQFDDDGFFPAFDSLDGYTYTLGASRYFLTPWYRLPTWTLGMDFEWADTEGDDFRYGSVRVYGDATLMLMDRLNFVGSYGFGYREYPDFTGIVSRDEFTWRVGGRLSYQVTSICSIALVSNYDRFASQNVNFDVDRYTGGIVSTLRY